MDPTASPGVRNCSQCDKAVLAAPTEADVDHHTSLGHCVFSPTVHGSLLVAKPEDPPGPPPLAGAPVPSPESIPVPNPPPPAPRRCPDATEATEAITAPLKPDYGVGGTPARSDEEMARWLNGREVLIKKEPDKPQAIIEAPLGDTDSDLIVSLSSGPPQAPSRLPLVIGAVVLAVSAVLECCIFR